MATATTTAADTTHQRPQVATASASTAPGYNSRCAGTVPSACTSIASTGCFSPYSSCTLAVLHSLQFLLPGLDSVRKPMSRCGERLPCLRPAVLEAVEREQEQGGLSDILR